MNRRTHPSSITDPLGFARSVLERIVSGDRIRRDDETTDANVRWRVDGCWTSFQIHALGTAFVVADTDADESVSIQIDTAHLERRYHASPAEILSIVAAIEPPRALSAAFSAVAAHVAALAVDAMSRAGIPTDGACLHLRRPLGDAERVQILVMRRGSVVEEVVASPPLRAYALTAPPSAFTTHRAPFTPTGFRTSRCVLVSGETADVPLDGIDAIATMRALAATPPEARWEIPSWTGMDRDDQERTAA